MKNYIALYEGSYQFFSIYSDSNISTDFLQMKLAKQFEYRETHETLWGEIRQDGIIKRFVLDYNNNSIKEIQFN